MRKFTKAAAMLCAAAMVIPSASVFAAEDGGASELTEVGTYPISEEPLEFTMFRTNMPNVEDFQTNDFTKYMEDLTNIKFTFEAVARDDRAEKLNMEFNTNTYPDVIMHYAPDAAKWGVEEGILIPLDDLIEANMPNYMEKMGQYLDQMRETDGHIYQLAGLNECYHCQYARKMWVNTKYLDEMGVDVPQTTQEFYDVCKKFVETYPDKIAIGGASSGWYVDFVAWLMGSFTLDSGEYGKLALTPDGEMVSAATTEEWREGLRYIKSLYDIGAIYDGNFTQDSEQLRTIMNQEDVPVLFVPFGTISDGIDSDSNNEVYRQYQCISPLEGPDGTLPQLLGPGQEFMACVVGAGLLGFGIGIVFCNNGSTGGTDIIAWIINKYKDVTLGRMMMYCDIVIISSCYFIFHDWKRVLFGFCVLFIMSIVIDYVINSSRQSVQFLIFSRKHDEIAEGITKQIDRGVTLLDGTGWYSKQGIKVVVVLAKKSQSLDIFRLVKDIDPNAFISQSNVVGVYGEGFDKLKIK